MNSPELPALWTVSSIVLFAFCFFGGMILIGFPLGVWLAARSWDRIGVNLSKPSVEHVAELLKYRPPFLVYFSAELCILYSLLFLKIKLLIQKPFLKIKSKSAGNPRADNRPEDGSSNSINKRVNGVLGHNDSSANAKDDRREAFGPSTC